MTAADPPSRGRVGTVAALLASCHPAPTAVVTALAVALAVGVGRGGAGTVAVGAAVLSGQLAIGWTNDALDAARDRAAGRPDKPVARGDVSAVTVRRAAWVAAVACVPLSYLSGPPAGTVHLAVVASGLAYDFGLKSTRWSWVPYGVAFGLLPGFVTLGLPQPVWPAGWVTLTAALLGVAAHFVNALPDLDDDLRHGVRGLPQRVGARWSRRVAAALLLLATATLAVGPAGSPGPGDWVLVALGLAVAAAVAAWPWPPRSRAPFLLVASLALVDVVVLVGRAAHLT
jgi:4-hydroxybenzoate polyprenyltransferase